MQTRRVLQQMSDERLRDIGLRREDPPDSVIDDFFAKQNEQINAHNSTYANESKDYIISNPVYSSWEVTGRETNFETGRSIVYVSASRETPFLITREKLAFPVTFSSDGIWHILEIDVLNVNDAIQSITLDWSKLTSLNFMQEAKYGNCALDFISTNYSEKTIEVEANAIQKTSKGFGKSVTENSNIKYDTKYDLSNFQACRNQIYQEIDEANAKFRKESQFHDGRYLRDTYSPIATTSLYFLSECDSGGRDGADIYRIVLKSHKFAVQVSSIISGYYYTWYSRDYI